MLKRSKKHKLNIITLKVTIKDVGQITINEIKIKTINKVNNTN